MTSMDGDLAGLARRHQPAALRCAAEACHRFAESLGARGDEGVRNAYDRFSRELRTDAESIESRTRGRS